MSYGVLKLPIHDFSESEIQIDLNQINFIFSEAIEKIDARFDLVMITDRFEESIILMKEMLCMSDDDVIYLALKVINTKVFDYFENR